MTDPQDLARLSELADHRVEDALALVEALAESLDVDRGARLAHAERVLSRWGSERAVLRALGVASGSLVDEDDLNRAAPAEPLFGALVQALTAALDAEPVPAEQQRTARALATAARIAGHRHDAAAERAHQLLSAAPDATWYDHYNAGLFYKHRARFVDGLEANRRAVTLGGGDTPAVLWNLGICATGAHDGEAALDCWRRVGCTVELGDEGLPEGSFPLAQVRLVERPVAERGADDDTPGLDETVWIRRLSPCHGEILSPTFTELGADYGDVVLYDGAPILTRVIQGRDVPVFPHLVTWRRPRWRRHRFAATQAEAGQVAALGERLGEGASLYVHTERMRMLCRACWERPDEGHAHEGAEDHRVVTGKLVFPDDLGATAVAQALRGALEAHPAVTLLVPELWAAVGDAHRADIERRRWGMLAGDVPML